MSYGQLDQPRRIFRNDKPAQTETPHTVAMVEVDKSLSDVEKCEVAFMKTNTIDCGWWENTEVTAMFPEKTCRSTSSGDFVLIGNTKYKCVRVGWEKV